MRSILMSVVREFKLIFRNGISIYLVVSPAIMALIFIMIFGGMKSDSISIAVAGNFPEQSAAELEAAADILYFDDIESMKERIVGADSIAGVYMADGAVRLLVEGNEPAGFAASMQDLVGRAIGSGVMEYTELQLEGDGSAAYNVSMAAILLLAMFIGGATLGLGSVNERENGIIRAISISPMTLIGYVVSKIIPASMLSTAGVISCLVIMGRLDQLLHYLLLCICSVFVFGLITFLIAAFANNLIAAIGVLKIVMPLFLTVGISTAFIPQKWQALYYALPMYWQYVSIDAIRSGRVPGQSLIMVILSSAPWFFLGLVFFAKNTKMKLWR